MTAKWIDTGVNWLLPYVSLVTNDKDYKRICKSKGLNTNGEQWLRETAEALTHTFTNIAGRGQCICLVCIRPNKKDTIAAIAGLLAHEAYHVVNSRLEQMSEHSPGQEVMAYLIQFVTYRLIEDYMRQVHPGRKETF